MQGAGSAAIAKLGDGSRKSTQYDIRVEGGCWASDDPVAGLDPGMCRQFVFVDLFRTGCCYEEAVNFIGTSEMFSMSKDCLLFSTNMFQTCLFFTNNWIFFNFYNRQFK